MLNFLKVGLFLIPFPSLTKPNPEPLFMEQNVLQAQHSIPVEVLKLQSVHIQNMSEGTNSNKMFLKINSHSFSFFCYSVALPHFAPEKRIASGATAAEVSPS